MFYFDHRDRDHRDNVVTADNWKISWEVFVNRNENVIPLQRQMKEVAEAAIKDKNYKH